LNPGPQPPRFTVEWADRAVADLTSAFAAYFPTRSGNRVTSAERIVNLLLADDPTRNGRLLSEGLYRLVVSPLVVFYEIDLLGQVVRITDIGHLPA
jgi:hypothetical protein